MSDRSRSVRAPPKGDGGHTFHTWLGGCWTGVVGARRRRPRYLALPGGIFLLFVAFYLAMWNWQKLQSIGRWQR